MKPLYTCVIVAALAGSICSGTPTYNLRDGRYFPDGPGSPFNTFKSGTFTSTTSDSLAVSFSTDPGNPADADTFDGFTSVGTGPFLLATDNAVTINTATTNFSNIGIYSIVQSGISDPGVVVTGGSGTGYLLPTFHVQGTLGDSNPNALVADEICAGNGSCILSSIFPAITSGIQHVDGSYTPAIGSDTSFQFGTPFSFFFFFGSAIEEFNSPNPGGTTLADLTLQFEGFQVVDANGNPIRGAQIHSPFLDAINAPEPGTAATGLLALPVLGMLAIRRTWTGFGWLYRESLRVDLTKGGNS